MRIKFCIFLLFLLVKSTSLFSQVAINADGSNPNNSAMLDVKSNNKGFLPPRMSRVEMNAIPTPADGLIIYCTDCGQDGNGVLSIFMGGDWKTLIANCLTPLAPTIKPSIVTTSGIKWDWQGVPYATGYKWNTSNDYGTANQMDTVTTKTETGLACNTSYTRYVWAYNSCGNSLPLTMTQTTLACSVPTLTTTAASSVGSATATSGGYVIGDGGSPVTARGVCWGTSPNPTIANSKTTDGTGMGIFVSSITGLTDNTTYYLRAYATNGGGTGYGTEITFKTLLLMDILFVTDIDGNIYHKVTIGTQTWLVENLKTTKYRNGDPIENVIENAAWSKLVTGAYCWFNNDAATYKETYGALYNWYAVNDSRNIAPTGWHVPTDAEWATLITFLGGESVAGGKLKESGTTHWTSPNSATNSTGFTALPGGPRYDYDGSFGFVGPNGYWWSSTAGDATLAWYRNIYYYNTTVLHNTDGKKSGYSVRCIKD